MVSPAREAATGRIGLRAVTRGVFATPLFGDAPTQLVVHEGVWGPRSFALRTLTELGARPARAARDFVMTALGRLRRR